MNDDKQVVLSHKHVSLFLQCDWWLFQSMSGLTHRSATHLQCSEVKLAQITVICIMYYNRIHDAIV